MDGQREGDGRALPGVERDPLEPAELLRRVLAGGRIVSLKVLGATRTLAEVGSPALAPVHGTLTGAGGAPIGASIPGLLTASAAVVGLAACSMVRVLPVNHGQVDRSRNEHSSNGILNIRRILQP